MRSTKRAARLRLFGWGKASRSCRSIGRRLAIETNRRSSVLGHWVENGERKNHCQALELLESLVTMTPSSSTVPGVPDNFRSSSADRPPSLKIQIETRGHLSTS